MKQAFLIIAHDEYRLLSILLSLLDNPQADIYLLIDKKSDMPEQNLLQVRSSHLYVLKRRIDIRWGDVSQIQAEILLFKTAFDNGPYMFYHLLSGTDLPIKPTEQILEFFQKHDGENFVEISKEEDWLRRVNRYHLLTKYLKLGGGKRAYCQSCPLLFRIFCKQDVRKKCCWNQF